MSTVSAYKGALLATFRRDLRIFLSYRARWLGQAVAMLFTLTLYHYLSELVRPHALGAQGNYYAFVVVGIVSMGVLSSAVGTAQIVRMELMAGNFERILISPLGPVAGVVALALFPIAYSTLFAGGMLVLATTMFSVPIHLGGIPAALLVGGLGALAFGAIGLFFVAALLVFKSSTATSWVLAGLGMLGGIYFPIHLLPSFVQWVADVQPLTPAIDLLRHFLMHSGTLEPVWGELLKLAAFALALLPVSVGVLWMAVDISRRRGTIMEF